MRSSRLKQSNAKTEHLVPPAEPVSAEGIWELCWSAVSIDCVKYGSAAAVLPATASAACPWPASCGSHTGAAHKQHPACTTRHGCQAVHQHINTLHGTWEIALHKCLQHKSTLSKNFTISNAHIQPSITHQSATPVAQSGRGAMPYMSWVLMRRPSAPDGLPCQPALRCCWQEQQNTSSNNLPEELQAQYPQTPAQPMLQQGKVVHLSSDAHEACIISRGEKGQLSDQVQFMAKQTPCNRPHPHTNQADCLPLLW